MRSKIVEIYKGIATHPYYLPPGTAKRGFIVVWKDRDGDTRKTRIDEDGYYEAGAVMPEFLFKQACAKIRKILKNEKSSKSKKRKKKNPKSKK